MMKITILDTCTVTNGDVSLESIAKLGEVKFYDVIEPENIPAIIGDSDAVICNKAKITADIMDKCPNLKYAGVFATGYNNIDLVASGKADVMKMVSGIYEMDDALAAFKALAHNDGTLAKLLIHIG